MTYTFKLARRLAVSRTFTMLPVLLVLASCGGDATAPDGTPGESPKSGTEWRPRDITPVEVSVSPRSVTLETNQLIKFRAHGLTSAGDSVGAAVTWSTSGGTILPDGRFSAAAIGTYTVIGLNRVRGNVQVDTSLVTVVRRQPLLVAVEVTPTSVSLTPGLRQTFTALGRLNGGSPVPIGVNWSATGGSIDAGGTYVAGDTAGTYRVIATNTAGTLADTAAVSITAPPAPPPPPTPTPPPVSTAAKLVLMPHAATLVPGTTRQFAAFGRTAEGDSVTVTVTFAATGGTVDASGLYTAGSAPGNFRIIATAGHLADTSGITVTRPLSSATVGVPFGPFRAWNNATLKPNTEVFNLTMGTEQPWSLIDRLTYARSRGVKMMINMTGGAHQNYLTNGVFDMAKWKAKLNTFNTPAIRAAVAEAVADGTLIGNSVLDEPHHYGLGDPNNSWGPKGTFTKARVDSMCADAKTMFPTLPAGVVHDHAVFEPEKSYRVCDFILDQYTWRKGDVVKFRDDGLALARRDGHAIAFSLNVLDGGIQAPRDGLWNCPANSGGRGTFEPNCRMTAQQVQDWGLTLGPAGCALTMWWYEDDFMANAANQQAFKQIADRLATISNNGCRRPS